MAETSALDSIREQLARDHAALLAAIDQVPQEWRDRRVHPDRWSVSEVVEHLCAVERGVGMLMAGFVQAAPVQGDDAPSFHIETEQQLRGVLLDRKTKIVAPERIHPTGTMDTAAALAMLEGLRAGLLETIRNAEGRDLSHVSRPHPVLGTLNGYQWLMSTAGHEARHAAQIAELAEQIPS
jgi:hypothetical protein